MSRPDRDQLGLLLAHAWALRATCARRRVGCVLVDAQGVELATGYNGPPRGFPHCTDRPCPGALLPSGTGLDVCEANHGEANALLQCADVRRVWTCYVTASPCFHCVKLLLNTGCRRVVYAQEYPHRNSRELWLDAGDGREWVCLRPEWAIYPVDEQGLITSRSSYHDYR